MLIGNTPLVQLKKIEEKYALSAHLFAKVESANEGGSIKDRVALAIIEDAEARDALQAGGTIVEATSGNTGIGLALVAKAKGYKAVIVMPDTMSLERRQLIASYGAEVLLTDGKAGMQGAVEKAQEIVKNTPNAVLADQFNNPVCAVVHRETTAVEIDRQLGGNVDVFVVGVGTGGTLTGVGGYLKDKYKSVFVAAVEPARSPLLSKGWAAAHAIQGIGANFVPSILDTTIYDEVLTVNDEAAMDMADLLCKEEDLSVGISSGGNVCAAVALAMRPENAGKNIVTILPDDRNRYLSVLKKV